MKKDILIAAPPFDEGGAVQSLLSLLHRIDYEKYNVDLILMRSEGKYMDLIPPQVRLLPPALNEKNYCMAKLRKFFSYLFRGYLIYREFYRVTRGKQYRCGDFQLMSGLARCNTARKPKKTYYAAIGYMEGFENAYIAKKVKANKKIGYIHVDYINAGLDPMLDRGIFKMLDKIVLVSAENKKSFDKVFEEYADKSVVVENIVCEELVSELAKENADDFAPDSDYFNIVTAARLVVAHKGLDRAVKAAVKLKTAGYKVRWYVFGEGSDRSVLEKLIKQNGVEDNFILMGSRKNVYPYIKKCDMMVLPSRYEGKPIAVSEAQILKVVPLVTEYASAHEQIKNEVDGLIVENNDDAVYDGIKRVLDEKGLLEKLKKQLERGEKDFEKGLEQFYKVLENV